MGWFEERFIENHKKFKFNCIICGNPMWFPKSKYGKYKTCGGECAEQNLKNEKEKRKRNCIKCGKLFYPRTQQIKSGVGKYCSQKCNVDKTKFSKTEEAKKKRLASYRKTMEMKGYPRGEKHPRWKGGAKEGIKRRIESGKANEATKNYRKNNPEKVKEWVLRRKSKKYGRLPRGFLVDLKQKQNCRCAICKNILPKGYHVDHIYPIAKGGKHEPNNIQLLCPSCNTRKSAKDPIEYMQSLGFLI